MQYAYSVAVTRDLEAVAMAAAGDDALMQRAAHGLSVRVAAELQRRRGSVVGASVVILVGPGNNGGDALFAGARLATRGCRVEAVAALGQPHPEGLRALLAVGGRLRSLADVSARWPDTDIVIDGVLGIGGRAGLPDDLAQAARELRAAATVVIAVDLPSGVETDTGAVPGAAISATRTVTFGTRKACHLLEPARSACGDVEIIDIGLSVEDAAAALASWEPGDVAAAWPVPGPTADKYARGVVGVDTGSDDYPGAAVLSTYGAVYGGAGMVRFRGPEAARSVLVERLPNVVHADGRVQSWVLGSGWGDRPDGKSRVQEAVETGLPLVLDADALSRLPDRLSDQVLLTPHAGELARLLGRERAEVTADPVGAVRAAADRTGATVLLKGASQLVATPGGVTVDLAVPGPSWTGQAGSGDVLGGLCAALLAAGVSAREAGVLGASIQALAARKHPGPLPPQDLAVRVAEVIGELSTSRPELVEGSLDASTSSAREAAQ